MKLTYNALLLAGLTCFAVSFAFGQQQVAMDLTGVNGQSYAGVYTSPYQATINGVATTVICDDFGTESSINETWNAYVTSVNGVTSPYAKFSGANVTQASVSTQQAYDAVAALATEILSLNPSSSQAIELSFAIWDIFDYSGVNSWLNTPSYGVSSTFINDVNLDALNALDATYTAGAYSNVYIYSSTTGSPQEFIAVGPVSSPEPSTIAILVVDMFAVGALILLVRRRALRMAGRGWLTKPVR